MFVDAYAVLAKSVAFQLLKMIARRFRKVGEGAGSMNDEKLPCGRPENDWRKVARLFAPKERLRMFVREGLDHRGE